MDGKKPRTGGPGHSGEQLAITSRPTSLPRLDLHSTRINSGIGQRGRRARYARESAACALAHPSRLVATSADIGWAPLLVDEMEGHGHSAIFETNSTPDLTLIVAMGGAHQLSAARGRRWHKAYYQPGTAGVILPEDNVRLKWDSESPVFRTAHVYLPTATLAATAEEYRRAGQRCDVSHCSKLALADPAIAHVVIELVRAMRAQASGLYAEQAGMWLASHLLFKYAGKIDEDDNRFVGTISDRRLARTLEFMSANLDRELTLADLAREAGISLHHFGKVFRRATGKTPASVFLEMRLAYGRRTILTSSLSIADIAARCGYSRATSFTAAFTRQFGQSPTAVRRASVAMH